MNVGLDQGIKMLSNIIDSAAISAVVPRDSIIMSSFLCCGESVALPMMAAELESNPFVGIEMWNV